MPKQSTTGERRNLTEESPQGRSPQINGRVCFFVFFRVFLSRNCRFEPALLFTSLLDLFLYNVIVCKNIEDLVSLSAQAQHRRNI
jgi:hypothetical protein